MGEDTVNKGVRFPVSLLQRIEDVAEEQDRTFSQEVIHLCKEGLRNYKLDKEMREVCDDFKLKHATQFIGGEMAAESESAYNVNKEGGEEEVI